MRPDIEWREDGDFVVFGENYWLIPGTQLED
jgi:hypothetical protein